MYEQTVTNDLAFSPPKTHHEIEITLSPHEKLTQPLSPDVLLHVAICGRRSIADSAVRCQSCLNQFLELLHRYTSRPITSFLHRRAESVRSSSQPLVVCAGTSALELSCWFRADDEARLRR